MDEENNMLLPQAEKLDGSSGTTVFLTRVTAAVLCVLSIGVLISSAGRDISELTKNSNSELASVAKPNVIFVMVDDAGWGDFGYHSTDFTKATPNIDRLSSEGVRLENYYTDSVCTPSRASFLTGKSTLNTGMWYSLIDMNSEWGLEESFQTIGNYFKSVGYYTAAVGKWHVGHWKKSMWPTSRGFDFYTGLIASQLCSYTDWTYCEPGDSTKTPVILDAAYGTEAARNVPGTYSTFYQQEEAQKLIARRAASGQKDGLFLYLAFNAMHTDLSVPDEFRDSDEYSNLMTVGDSTLSKGRAKAAGAMYLCDKAIGAVVDTLKEHDMYENTIIALSSDNGGSYHSSGSNYPYRGTKGLYSEGGIKVPAMVHSPLLSDAAKGSVYDGLFHVTDWVPTLLTAAGLDSDAVITAQGGDTDGVSQWDALMNPASVSLADASSLPRSEIMHQIDFLSTVGGQIYVDSDEVMAAFTRVVGGSQYKILTATSIGGYGQPFTEDIYNDSEDIGYYLFDLTADPLESNNLWDDERYSSLKKDLLTGMCDYYTSMIAPAFSPNVDSHAFWVAVNSTKKDPMDPTELGYVTYWHNDHNSALPAYTKEAFESYAKAGDDFYCPFKALQTMSYGAHSNPKLATRKGKGRLGSPGLELSLAMLSLPI